MNLPQLLRRLQVMAAARDERGTQDTLDLINVNEGWQRDLEDFVDHMAPSEQSFLEDFFDNPGDSFLGQGGGYVSSGVNPASLSTPLTMAGVTRDATSGIYMPATAAEWTQTMNVAGIGSGGPGLLWDCTVAAGNLTDLIGSFTATAGGTGLTYQSAVAGWSAKGIATTDAGTGSFSNTSASLLDTATNSYLTLTYYLLSAATSVIRNTMASGITVITTSRFTAADKLQVTSGANTGVGTQAHEGQVRPYVLKWDFTHSLSLTYSDLEKVSATAGVIAGKKVSWGNPDPAGTLLYHATFFGAAAELTDAQIKTLLQTLGWNPAWT